MTTQNYLVVQNNVVTNTVVWDGGSEWTPPTDATMLVQETTPAFVWELNSTKTAYELVEVVGAGGIGFTWNGTVLTTNNPAPLLPIIITPSTLPSAIVNTAYSATIQASNGTSPYTYKIVDYLPQGLSFINNVITGTPVVTGTYTFNIIATDSRDISGTTLMTLEINAN